MFKKNKNCTIKPAVKDIKYSIRSHVTNLNSQKCDANFIISQSAFLDEHSSLRNQNKLPFVAMDFISILTVFSCVFQVK